MGFKLQLPMLQCRAAVIHQGSGFGSWVPCLAMVLPSRRPWLQPAHHFHSDLLCHTSQDGAEGAGELLT